MYAGTRRVDITPAGPVWMDGMIRSHRSTGVHDPLFARALVLGSAEDPSKAFCFVSVDACALTEQNCAAVRSLASRSTGIPADHMIVAATHTHSGPAVVGFFNAPEPGYKDTLIEKAARAITDAAGDLRRVSVACASGAETTISHYRRLLADDGHVVMNWETFPPERIVKVLGEIDPEVGVLSFVEDAQPHTPVCTIFTHAGHPNVMSGDNYLISADYPGVAVRRVEEKLGGRAIFFNGAQGSVDIDGLRDRDWSGVDRVGGALADAVVAALGSVRSPADVPVRGASLRYETPARKITTQEWDWAQRILAETEGKVQAVADGVGDDYKAMLYRNLRASENAPVSVEQTCVAVGDTALISFPGELFAEIGVRIKAQSPFAHTYVLGLANGYIGYVPTEKAVREGGYEADTRRVAADAEKTIVKQSVELLKRVHSL